MSFKGLNTKIVILKITISFALLLSLSGCSGGGSGSDEPRDIDEPKDLMGQFIDNAVQGLVYETSSQQGATDEQGTFTYRSGEIVTFKLGDTILGRVIGKPIVTPIDLVPGAEDENDSKVTNLCRFIQALDEDGDPGNGIFISQATHNLLYGTVIDFSLPVLEFSLNAEVIEFFARLAEAKGLLTLEARPVDVLLPSIYQARRHLCVSMVAHGLMAAVSAGGVFMGDNGPVDDDPSDGIALVEQRSVAGADAAAMDRLVQANNGFAFRLGQKFSSLDNFTSSPYTISSVLGMVLAGAGQSSAATIGQAAGFDLEEPALHQAFNSLDLSLNTPGQVAGNPFSSGLAGWAQQEYTVFVDFYNTLAAYYGASLAPLDFRAGDYQSRPSIEAWIAEQFTDLASPPTLSFGERTRITVAATSTFSGQWATPFAADQTQERAFECEDGDLINVPTMHVIGEFGYAQREGFKAVQLPFEDQRFAMLLLLPDSGQLVSVENDLAVNGLTPVLDLLSPATVDLYLPKFNYTSSAAINFELNALGLNNVWNEESADFSRIHPLDKLFVQNVEHKAVIAVHENQAIAAACSTLAMQGLEDMPVWPDSGFTGIIVIQPPPEPPQGADAAFSRPFLYFIYDTKTQVVIFSGRELNPWPWFRQ
jgi:serpin B